MSTAARDRAGGLRLYPASVSHDTLEAHFARYSGGGRAMYLSIVALAVALVAALPFIFVDVWVQSTGIIRPLTDLHEIRAMVSGPVQSLRVSENQRVRAGDALLTIRSAGVEDRGALLDGQTAARQAEEADLARLVAVDSAVSIPADAWRTSLYRQEYARFTAELRAAMARREKARDEWRRVRTLESQRFATRADLEDKAFALDQASSDVALVISRAHAQWQEALTSHRATVADLRSQRTQLRDERSLYTVAAPVDGTVEELRSLSAGSFLQAGERIAVISPAAALVAEVWVSPRDIGRVRVGLPVRLLVDAFNFHDWGVVDGTVAAVGDDYVMVDGHPMFRVRCALARTRLVRGGRAAELRKGMTLRARFVLGRRSLLQLLRDDVDGWLG